MLNPLIRTLVKVLVASLIVGTILSHFGITAEQLIKESGLSYERVEDMARRGLSCVCGRGMNSSASPGTVSKHPRAHSSLACSIRSGREDTKFHQM